MYTRWERTWRNNMQPRTASSQTGLRAQRDATQAWLRAGREVVVWRAMWRAKNVDDVLAHVAATSSRAYQRTSDALAAGHRAMRIGQRVFCECACGELSGRYKRNSRRTTLRAHLRQHKGVVVRVVQSLRAPGVCARSGEIRRVSRVRAGVFNIPGEGRKGRPGARRGVFMQALPAY